MVRAKLGTAIRILLVVGLAVGSGAAWLYAPARALASGAAALIPDAGQFVSVPITRVLDTRYGTGGVPVQPVPANGTVTFPVAGVAGVPAGAAAVVLYVTALNPPAKGFLSVYNADSPDPGIATVGLRASSVMNGQTATVPVSSANTVSLTNHSSGSMDITASVVGYYTATAPSSAGDTYFGLPWSAIANTTTGFNVPQAQIPAGGSLTIQVAGRGGFPSGADTAVMQVNAINATQAGYLTAYAAGTTDPGIAALSYNSDTYYRNLLYVPLSASGQATITNRGAAPVDVSVYARGYYMSPTTSPSGGQYWPLDAQTIYSVTQLAANASATFQVTGTGDIPDSNVAAVSEDVVVSNPTAQGRLNEGPANGIAQPVVSFLAGDTAYAGYDNGLVSTLSPTGQETITNQSSGTVDVQVAVTGWFRAARVPGSPQSVAATVSGSSATVTWATPPTDGGSPITSYTVTASPDSATVTVSGSATQATLSGLANASTDSFTVTAINAVGSSPVGAYSPIAAATVSGTVLAPSGSVVGAGFPVNIYLSDPPSLSTTDWTPTLLGTATTDASGNWSFTLPPYASLPSAAQVAASNNDGTLNVEAAASGVASTGGTTYDENAVTDESAWVGTSTQVVAPANYQQPAAQAMTLQPPGTDLSASDTPANQASTWSSQNYYGATDSTGTLITNSASESTNTAAPTDAYGFQEMTPDNYNPFIATNGTNLASVTPAVPTGRSCGITNYHVLSSWVSRTKFGEENSGWNNTGNLTLGKDGQLSIGTLFSSDAVDWKLSGGLTYTYTNSITMKTPSVGPNVAHFVWLQMDYERQRRHHVCIDPHTSEILSQWDTWWRGTVGIHAVSYPDTSGNFYAGQTNYYSTYDGPNGMTAMKNAGHKDYIGPIPAGSTICISSKSALDYKVGVSIAGIGVWAQSTRSDTTQQCIVEGNSTTHTHWVWSPYGNPTQYDTGVALRVIYSS